MPWVPWVTQSITSGLCPKLGEEERCQWPAALSLSVVRGGAEFYFDVYVETEGWVPLPGAASHWPEAVMVDGKAAAVLSLAGAPVTRLSKGPHRLTGTFVWSRPPETLELPHDVALVSLRVNGTAIEFPRREQSGALWLQASGVDDEAGAERVELQVFRRLDDGVPLQVTTELVLDIAGKTRELRLHGAALLGSRALAMQSPIPARFEKNDELVLYAHAGEHRITLTSLYVTPPERIALPKQAAPWPDHETWVFVPNSALRQVELTGAPSVDVAQTNLPDDWKAYSAWLMDKDRTLAFQTKRRGEPDPAPNQLMLSREYWLDFDGEGYTIADHLTGVLNQGFRLDLPVAALGHATQDGKDLLITKSVRGASGVELRQAKLDLKAEWRLERATFSLPAVGWDADVSGLSATLHLPPGFELIHATGVDRVGESWWADWTLWGFFYVLLVSIAALKLFGISAGVLAFAALVMTHGREDAPTEFWAILLVFLALLRLVPSGWFRRVLRWAWLGTIVLFAVHAIQFSVGEIRAALFPTTRTRAEASFMTLGAPGVVAPQQVIVEGAPPPPPQAQFDAESARTEDEVDQAKGGARSKSRSAMPGGGRLAKAMQKLGSGDGDNYASTLVDPEAIVQTGPGLPSWEWRRVDLNWSGPVRHDQQLRLYLVGPIGNLLLGVLRVIATAWLAILLVRKTPFGENPPSLRERLHGRVSPSAVAAMTVLVAVVLPLRAQAEPRSETLEELKKRLVQAPVCDGCLEVEHLDFRLLNRALETQALVHAGKVTNYRVPGPVQSWVPAEVKIDGKAAPALVLGEDGFLHVRLEMGTHHVETRGPVAGRELVVTMGSPAHRVSVNATGWSVDGLRDGRVESGLHFVAEEKVGSDVERADAAYAESGHLPPWIEVTRTVELGVTWKITTEIRRKSPVGDPISLRYALLAGEEVTTPRAIVEKGELVFTLGRDEQAVTYQSVLKQSSQLSLVASSERPISEEWRVRCAALWHCEFSGLVPYGRIDAGGYFPRFRPWPKESLLVAVHKPAPVSGDSHTLERVFAQVTPGKRLLSGSLELSIKVSKAYTQSIRLEPNSTVQLLTVDGKNEPIRNNGDRIEISLQPGNHEVALNWHEPRPQSVFFRTPRIAIGEKAINAKINLSLPADRWLWFTWGPSWGPKVLLWSYLLMLIGAGWILVRIPGNPLRVRQWVLLGIGLTQIPVVVAFLIAAWFFLISWRGSANLRNRALKNLTQVGLAVYSLVFLACLCGAVYDGLVSNPDMLVTGAGSTQNELSWLVDRIEGTLPSAIVISVPVVVFRLLNLLWALWLASSLLGWLRWAWSNYAAGGLWVPKPKAPVFVSESPQTRAGNAQEPTTTAVASSSDGTPPPGA